MLLNCGLEKALKSSLNHKEIQPVHPKWHQFWMFIGRTDAEAEVPVLWPVDVKGQIIGKDPDAGKDWRWEEKGTTEDEMVGWHHWLDGHEFEQALGGRDGQGGLACCSPWDHKELDLMSNWTTEQASQVALTVKNPPANAWDIREVSSIARLGGKIPWRRVL